MITTPVKVVGLILPILFTACSSNSDNTEADSKQQLSERIDLSHLQRPVLFAASQIQGFTPAKEMDSQTKDFHEFAVSEYAQDSDLSQLRQQLKLKPNQILLLGNLAQTQQQSMLIDLFEGQIFKQAWQLSLNHLRYLKTPPVLVQDAYESTPDFQKRLDQHQQKHQQLTEKMQLDLGHLENAVNFLAQSMRLSQFPDPWNQMTYDPDQQILSTRLSYPSIAHPLESELSESEQASVVYFQVKMVAEQAKKLIESIQSPSDDRHYIAYILGLDKGHFQLEQVAIIQANFSFGNTKAIYALNPEAIYLQQLDQTGQVLSQQVIYLDQPLNFVFNTPYLTTSQSDNVGLGNGEI